jgi:hypothetical protein
LTSNTLLDRLRIHLQHRTVAGDAGIGDDDVDATEMFDGLGGRGLHGGQIAHIRGNRQPILVATEPGGCCGERGFVEVGQHEFGAFVMQPPSNFGADPPAHPL